MLAAGIEEEPGEAASALLIAEVQRRLFAIGLYTGPDDGVLSPDTVFAIRVFQERNDLPVDGKVTPALMAALDAVGLQARKLRERLAAVRSREADEARVALDASPAVQALLAPQGAQPAAVTPADAAACTRAPRPACVAALALAAALQVADADRRDWLLADLAGLGARTGQPDLARAALQGIADPRTVVTVLGAFAAAAAAAGDDADAATLAEAIPWAWARGEAWVAVAQSAAAAGRGDMADRALYRAWAEATEGRAEASAATDDSARRTDVLARLAQAAHGLGAGEMAAAALDAAQVIAAGLGPGEQRDLASSHAAVAAAALGRPADASALALAVADPWRRASAVLAALAAATKAGAWDLTGPLVAAVAEPRYAVLAHARLAAALAIAGREDEARAALAAARALMPELAAGYAQAFATAAMATAEIALGDLAAASATIAAMEPGRLKVDALAALAAAGGPPTDLAAEARLIPDEVERLEALYVLKAPPEAGEGGAGWQAALVAEAAAQPDPWIRSRALARLARRMAGLP